MSISIIDAFTSIVCGCTVFSVLGYIAQTQSRNVEDIVKQGPGLIFMVLPEAIKTMKVSPLWSILFFSMIFMLGIDSQFTINRQDFGISFGKGKINDEIQIKASLFVKK